MNNLAIQINENEIEWTPKHQEFAISIIHNVRPDIIFEFVNKFKLTDQVNSEFFEKIAAKHLANGRYHEAALII